MPDIPSTTDIEHKSDQADRAISTGKLHALLRLHTRPINVVVYHGSQGSSGFEVGFPLRCFQRFEVAPGFGTKGLSGGGGCSVMVDGADDEETETEV